ncbi:MAG: DUF2779 domain-containing protein [Chlorobium sp.]|nr:DUF2779 domain-containing protein [Chlorobium sp.]
MENTRQLATPYLSKSLYIKGLQCHKALWLLKNRPELKSKPSAAQQSAFDSGTDVGILAQQLFPGGVEVPYNGLTHAEQLSRTEGLIADGTTTIYEATFSYDNVLVKVDILHKGESGWEIYEVKSSTECKEVYLNDIAVQCYVAAGSGIQITRACLVHINNRYVRYGNIEVEKLFTILDVTERILTRQANVPDKLTAMREPLGQDMPVIDIGPHCEKPYLCDFKGYCWSHIPADSVFSLRDHGKPDPFKLYRQGIIHMCDVPTEKLGWRQRLQMDGFLQQKNVVKTEAVSKFINALWYPLCFLDFETTYLNAVPLFDGTTPNQQVPFQYSLHILETPGAELQHLEFLAPTDKNPQEALLQSLLAALPKDACILTWNQAFEKGRLEELAKYSPDHKQEIVGILKNIRDLMAPFRRKDIYHWQFGGSYSIKAVLPALVPELSYKGLAVSNGEMAASSWLRMRHEDDEGRIEELRLQLLEYCHLDTLAMVRILEKMRETLSGLIPMT